MSKRRDWDKVGEIRSKIKELGLSYKEGAERFGISVGVLYEYNKRQKKGSIEGVSSGTVETERKASRRSRYLPAELQDMIAEYRRSNPEHGFKRIQDHLKAKHLVVVTRKQIREVLREHGLLETLDSSFDREPSKGTRRFEAEYPGQLYHIVSEPHSPQTCGKVERLIQTIKKELLHKVRFGSYEETKRGITDYIKSYNFDRPHQGIDGARPSDRFYGVIGETSRIEADLSGRKPDLKKGYLVYKIHDRTLSVICDQEGLQIFLDGKQLMEGYGHGTEY